MISKYLAHEKSVNFISSKHDNDEDYIIHLKSDNIEIMNNDEADEVIINSLKKRYLNT